MCKVVKVGDYFFNLIPMRKKRCSAHLDLPLSRANGKFNYTGRFFRYSLPGFLLGFLLLSGAMAQEPAQAQKFAEFGDTDVSYIIAVLDSFAIELNSQPTTRGFIIVYRTQRDLPGLSLRNALRMKDRLTYYNRVPEDRLIALDGGIADNLMQELWIVPTGKTPAIRKDAYSNDLAKFATTQKYDQHYFPSISGAVLEDVGSEYWGRALNIVLDGFGGVLRSQPNLTGYVIAYGGNRAAEWYELGASGKPRRQPADFDKPAYIRRILRERKDYLVKTFNLDPARVKTVNGGYHKFAAVELWLVPPDDAPPLPNKKPAPKNRRK